MSTSDSERSGLWSGSMDEEYEYIPDIFTHVEKMRINPVIVLPLPDGKAIDVWTFLAALYEVLDQDDSSTAQEMVEWLGIVIHKSMHELQEEKPRKSKNIAQIYKKETENFDERLEKFRASLDEETN